MAFFQKKTSPAAVDFDRLPRHIAIIMDGNGRWAKKRGLPRTAGAAACPGKRATPPGRKPSAPSPPTARKSAWST